MDATDRSLENALIYGLLAWFFGMAFLYVPHIAGVCGLPLAFFLHIVGVAYSLRVIRKKPYAALAALALNVSIWTMPLLTRTELFLSWFGT